MQAKILSRSGESIKLENILKIEIIFDAVDSLIVDNNRITYVEGQISQNEEKKWETLLP